MPLYRANGSVTGGKYLGVFLADNAEQAIEKAENSGEAHCSLCHQCSSQCENIEIESISVDEIKESELGEDEEVFE